jgi:yngK protein
MKKLMMIATLLATMLLAGATQLRAASLHSKREFRGAWIQTVNGQFTGMSTAAMQQTLKQQLDELQRDGVNAIIFQVRPECDAFYESKIEPWSRFLTGVQGQAPLPYWDPLKWMIAQCHRRGMELHAWINPYRAKTAGTKALARNHVAALYPNRTFAYNGQLILNPGLPENREHICRVVDDIVTRYDVDGIHIDDYFYPYPAAGQTIADDQEFRRYGGGFANKNDWRRNNVSAFVQQLGQTIKDRKPWVKFGVSPFGIYRNKKNDPVNGSATSGLQNYDDLYADVLLWVNKGWVDYCVPQLYWTIGHPAADYQTLAIWWNKYAGNRPLYIGESVEKTVKEPDLKNPATNQMEAKFKLRRMLPNVQGAVLWYAKAVADNMGSYGTALRTYYWKTPALQPLMPFIDHKRPKKPKHLEAVWTEDGLVLFWEEPKGKRWGDFAQKYVVYRFAPGEDIDIENPAKIVAITHDKWIKLPYNKGEVKYTYVVTALDRMSNESRKAKKKVLL